ncbi:hypothetical protein J6590_085995 [Homalodisca vitripennis]|nr:hypothetical protein J6590_085995 [Homalodisca vitripennis]
MAAQPMTSSRGSIIGHKKSRDARPCKYRPSSDISSPALTDVQIHQSSLQSVVALIIQLNKCTHRDMLQLTGIQLYKYKPTILLERTLPHAVFRSHTAVRCGCIHGLTGPLSGQELTADQRDDTVSRPFMSKQGILVSVASSFIGTDLRLDLITPKRDTSDF